MVDEQPDQPKQTNQNQQSEQPKTGKKNIWLIIWIILLCLVVVGVIVFACVTFMGRSKTKNTSSDGVASIIEEETKGEENIITIDETVSSYNVNSEEDFSFRFANLECNDDCSNVSSVKIGDQILKVGEDYEVKKGSVIITIFKKILKALSDGRHDIVVIVKQDEEVVTVSVNITIGENVSQEEQPSEGEPNIPNETTPNEAGSDSQGGSDSEPTPTPTPTPDPTPTPEPEPVIPTCNENQVLVENSCVDKEPEDTRRRINLNDDEYMVTWVGISYYLMGEDGQPITEDGRTVGGFGIGGFSIYRGDEIICENYSNQAKERGLTQAQFMEEQNRILNLGIYGGDGSGSAAKLSEKPEYCDLCNLRCERW